MTAGFARTSARPRFGDAMLLAFVVAQALDGMLTYVGITTFGAGAEGNPVVSWYVATFGAGIGLVAVKAMAIACAATLHLNARHAILGVLTLLYVGAAVLPWTSLLWL